MVLQKFEALEALQGSLLADLETVKKDDCDEQPEEESYFTKKIADSVIEYECLLKAAIVGMHYAHRGLKLKWVRNMERNGCDKISILQNDQQARNANENAAIISHLSDLLGMLDWISEFKRGFRETLKERHANKLIAKDYRRDEAIAELAVQYIDTKTDSQTVNLGQSTTKDKLLNKTKNLTSNLIKGNQILQSGVLQSDLNLDELQQQTRNLTTVNDKYTQFDAVFLRTNQLVKTLEKASHQEKRDVYISLGFLCLSISWVLWRRIFKLPTKLAFFVLFKFFKGILTTMGFVSRISKTNKQILAATVNIPEETHVSLTTAIDSVEYAVSEAMDRILRHDEL